MSLESVASSKITPFPSDAHEEKVSSVISAVKWQLHWQMHWRYQLDKIYFCDALLSVYI